jgi:transcription antitermination factor NusG
VHLPLFPSYVFVKVATTPDARVSVLRTNGVISFVGVRNVGVPIPESEVEAIQSVLEGGVTFEPHPYLEVGRRVCVRGGCLDGVNGILMAVNGDQSLVISVNLIQKSISLRIQGYMVEAV